MLFQTAQFALLFLATLVAFYGLPQRFRLRVLAASSLVFYAASGLLHFGLLLATLVISYRLSLWIRPRGPKWPMVTGVVLVFGSLGFFKYSEFVYEIANTNLTRLGLPTLPHVGGYLLPLGISFYTFQIVAYLFDLHSGRAQHARGLLHYMVFITFFGQLIAGPIMRASEYLGQLAHMRGARIADFQAGALLVLLGLVKPESTEGGRLVSILKWPEGAPLNLG